MDGGPPVFPRGFTCPAVLRIQSASLLLQVRGSHPLRPAFPCRSPGYLSRDDCPYPEELNPSVWPPPRSLATTCGISVDIFSWPYLDVSVQAVPPVRLFDSTHGDTRVPGSPIRKSADITDICSSPRLIAACHVLLRLLMPRHSPCALSSLTSSPSSSPHKLLFA